MAEISWLVDYCPSDGLFFQVKLFKEHCVPIVKISH